MSPALASGWEYAGWYGAGCYPDVEFDPHVRGKVYLASDVAGVWTSTDRGDHWTLSSRGLDNLIVPCLAASPASKDLVFAGTGKGLYRSEDGGRSWQVCGGPAAELVFVRPESHRAIALSRSDAGVIAAGGAQGDVYGSSDAGATWQVFGGEARPLGTSAVTVLRWSADGSSLWAGSRGGLARFAGGRWERSPGLSGEVSDLIAGPSGEWIAVCGGSLRISRDDGRNWNVLSEAPEGRFERVTVSPDGLLWAAFSGGGGGDVTSSRDGGVSWNTGRTRMNPDREADPTRAWAGARSRVNAIEADPFRPDILLRTDWWGVWRSDDGGRSWNEKIHGTANTVGSDIAVSAEGDVYAALMDTGLLRLRASAGKWEPLFPKAGYRDDVNGHVWRVVLPAGGRVLITSTPWNAGASQAAWSDDGGQTFRSSKAGLPASKPSRNTVWPKGYPKAIALDPSDPRRVYLGIDGDDDGGLYVSDDAGETWRASAGQPACRKVYNALAVDPSRPARLYWGAHDDEAGGLYVSEDAGRTWERRWEGMKRIFDLLVAPDGTVYTAGDADGPAVFKSNDAGRTWQALYREEGSSGAAEALCFLPGAPRGLAFGVVRWHGHAGRGIRISSDDGVTWRDVTGDLPASSGVAALAFDPRNEMLYAIQYGGGIWRLRLPRRIN